MLFLLWLLKFPHFGNINWVSVIFVFCSTISPCEIYLGWFKEGLFSFEEKIRAETKNFAELILVENFFPSGVPFLNVTFINLMIEWTMIFTSFSSGRISISSLLWRKFLQERNSIMFDANLANFQLSFVKILCDNNQNMPERPVFRTK